MVYHPNRVGQPLEVTMSFDPDYFRHRRIAYQDPSTRLAFNMARRIGNVTGTQDWLQGVERSIWRTNMRDLGELNTTVAKIGPAFLALQTEVIDRRPGLGEDDVLLRISGHFLPTN